jgi:hypothetical protein
MLNFTYLQKLEPEDLSGSTPNLVNLSIDADGVKPDDEEVRDLMTCYRPSLICSAR